MYRACSVKIHGKLHFGSRVGKLHFGYINNWTCFLHWRCFSLISTRKSAIVIGLMLATDRVSLQPGNCHPSNIASDMASSSLRVVGFHRLTSSQRCKFHLATNSASDIEFYDGSIEFQFVPAIVIGSTRRIGSRSRASRRISSRIFTGDPLLSGIIDERWLLSYALVDNRSHRVYLSTKDYTYILFAPTKLRCFPPLFRRGIIAYN